MSRFPLRYGVLALALGGFIATVQADDHHHRRPPHANTKPAPKPPHARPPGHIHHPPPGHAHRPPPYWHSRDQWRRAHSRHLHGRYFDDWHRSYYYRPGQWVWYQGRVWEPRRPLLNSEIGLTPLQAPGLWLDITARIPLN